VRGRRSGLKGHFQSQGAQTNAHKAAEIFTSAARHPNSSLSLVHPATSQHRQNGSPSRSLVSSELLRLLERLSRRRNACIGDMDHIALFDRRETSFYVQTLRQRHVTDFLSATATASKESPFDRVVLRPETCPEETPISNIENHQIRSTSSSHYHLISRDSFWLLHTLDHY
jgi:hypothetical protein